MKRFDERLAALREAVADPSAPGARKRILDALRGNNGMLVSVAVEALASATGDAGLIDASVDAFTRLLQEPGKRDPQCQGKTAIARVLRSAEVARDEVLLAGARHVQMEPVWGGSVDTAAELRGICVMALAESGHPRAMIEAAQLLADPLVAARSAAARAVGCSGNREVGEPLLRLRVAIGDEEPSVLGECFGALLQLAPDSAIELVAGRLRSRDEGVAEAAALALGESRLEAAFEPLRALAEDAVLSSERRVVLLALAMLRTETAWSQLLAWIEDAPRGLALDALRALGTFAHDERLARRVREAVERRPDDALASARSELFPPAELG